MSAPPPHRPRGVSLAYGTIQPPSFSSSDKPLPVHCTRCMFLLDTKEGRLIDDAEAKGALIPRRPYGKWLAEQVVDPVFRLPEQFGSLSVAGAMVRAMPVAMRHMRITTSGK